MKDPKESKRIDDLMCALEQLPEAKRHATLDMFIDYAKSLFTESKKEGPYSTSWIGLLKDLGKDGVTAQTLEDEAKVFWGIKPKN